MKQRTPFISAWAMAFTLAAGIYGLMGASSAEAGNHQMRNGNWNSGGYSHPSGGCGGCGETTPPADDCGCGATPPPSPPPPPSDCGCHTGGGRNINKNVNINENNNTNNVNVVVNVDANSSSSASATASANATANANTASNAASSAQPSNGGLAASNGVGGYSGGGSGGYYVSAPQAAPMGALNVVVRDQVVVKPVKGVCVSAKGLEEAARLSTPAHEVSPQDDVEVFHCVAGDMLVATIGRLVGTDGQQSSDYTGGYVIECREGEGLRHGSNGMLACTPHQGGLHESDYAGEGRGGYSEVLIRKTEQAEQSASAVGGGGYFSGGVGY